MPTIPTTMRAAAIDEFGGPEVLRLQRLPVATPAAGGAEFGSIPPAAIPASCVSFYESKPKIATAWTAHDQTKGWIE